MRFALVSFPVLAAFLSVAAASEPKPTPEQVQFFESRVRPLLVAYCHECHGPKKQSQGLRPDTPEGLRAGGDSGPVIVPGKPDESLLLKAVRHEGPKMPPKKQLKPEEIGVLAEWLRMGAPFPETRAAQVTKAGKSHWAFQPPAALAPPRVKNEAWPLNDVDRFILAALEARGLAPVAPADPRALLRRMTFDVTGLPPTPEEIDRFEELHRAGPQAAVEGLVNRLLASPAYGERWGRHWLDVVRYADTAGDNSDYPVPQMVKYRDWVIRAFNQDRPYDQFLREQIAGDLLPADTWAERCDRVIATGYLANARRFGSYEDKRYQWYLTFEDTIDNLGKTVLGLTIHCARCHDHKFDPLTMEDYYGLYGIFQSTRYPWPGTELSKAPYDLVPLVPPEQVEAAIKGRKDKLAILDEELKYRESEKAAAEKAVVEQMTPDTVKRAEAAKAALRIARTEHDKFGKTPLPFETAYAVAEGTRWVGNARIHQRGDPEKLGKEVSRRFPALLGGQPLPPNTPGSGRLQFAEWLTDPANPLTARVMVNRIWQGHFGKGLVQTPNDFGRQGKPPTHPELLDYLARRFVASGWSVKAIHRLILTSRTYQLSSISDGGLRSADSQDGTPSIRNPPSEIRNEEIDPNNDFLWRFTRRRLDAESVRDTMLMLSGNLDRSPGGPHPFPDQTTWDFTQHKPFKAVYDSNRRSVYLMTQRIQRHPYLALFDGPDTNASTGQRVTSTTPLQALYLMNNPFVHEQAKGFAIRLRAECPDDPGRIERAYRLAFGRPATEDEVSAGLEFLSQARARLGADGEQSAQAWESFCRVLFLANEFVYVN